MNSKPKVTDPNFSHLQGHFLLTCPECGEDFTIHTEWRAHLDKKHSYTNKMPKDLNFYLYDAEHYMCHTCDQLVLRNKPISILMLHLQYHYFMHATYPNIYKCLRCMKAFQRKRFLCEHLCNAHPITLYLIPGMKNFYEKSKSAGNTKASEISSEDNSFHKIKSIQAARSNASSSTKASTAASKKIPNAINSNNDKLKKQEIYKKTTANDSNRKESNSSASSAFVKKLTSDLSAYNSQNISSNVCHPEFYIRFVCPQCGKLFLRFKTWKEHIETAHRNTVQIVNLNMQKRSESGEVFCSICRKTLVSKDRQSLIRHYFEHLPYKFRYQCAFCCQRTKFKSELLIHIIKNHTKVYLENRKLIQTPVEFGAILDAETELELQELMLKTRQELMDEQSERKFQKPESSKKRPNEMQAQNNKTSSEQREPDLIEMALRASAIDFDDFNESPSKHKTPNKVSEPSEIGMNSTATDTTSNDALFRKPLPVTKNKVFHKLSHGATGNNSLLVNNKRKYENSFNNDVDKIGAVSTKRQKFDTSERNSSSSSSSSSSAKRIPVDPEKSKIRSCIRPYVSYQCIECGIDVSDYESLQKHMRSKHNPVQLINSDFQLRNDGKSYLCLKCKEVLNTKTQKVLFSHRTKHLAHKSFLRCNVCEETKCKEKSMYTHLMSAHNIYFGDDNNTTENVTKVEDTEVDNSDTESISSHFSIVKYDKSKNLSIQQRNGEISTADLLANNIKPFQLSEESFDIFMSYFLKARQRYEYIANNVDNEDFFIKQ